MAGGIKGLWRHQIGVEGTLGTEVNSTTYWRGPMSKIKDNSKPVYAEEDVAIIGGVGRSYTPYEIAEVAFEETEVTFEQLPYLCNMAIRGVAGVQDGAGTDYIYTYLFPVSTVYTPYTYTCEIGDNQQAELVTGVFVKELTISGASQEAWKMKATGTGWISSAPTTTFTSALSIPTVEEVLFQKSRIYIDAIGGTMGSTQRTNTLLDFELTIKEIYTEYATADNAGKNYTVILMNAMPEITLKFTLMHDSISVAERVIRRTRAGRQIRIEGVGNTVATPGSVYSTKRVQLNLVGTYDDPEEMDAETGSDIVKFSFRNHYHLTSASRGSIVVVNELSALP
jgi:hypothetical protein